MAYKLDVSVIIKDHLRTLVNDNTGKPDLRDLFFFVCVPFIVPAILLFNKIFIGKDFVAGIIAGLTIYVGLSLNLIVILFEIMRKDSVSQFKKKFIKDFIANICFSIILSLITILSALVTLIDENCIIKYISNSICFFLLTQMLLLILMLVKRMYYQLLEQTDE
jgi:hypothetical protein